MENETISVNEIFKKFKVYKIDIKLLCINDSSLVIKSYKKFYHPLLLSLFSDLFTLITEEEKDNILYSCIDIYDVLDKDGFNGGFLGININCEKADLDFFISEL